MWYHVRLPQGRPAQPILHRRQGEPLPAATLERYTVSSPLRRACDRLPMPGSMLLAAITLIACGGETEPTATRVGRPVGLSISPSGLSLVVGGVERLTALAYDAAGRTTSASFEWSSADPAVASVGKTDGSVTAIAAGSTTMTAAAGTLRATATVSVITMAGAIAFTRMTLSAGGTMEGGGWTSEVLSVPNRAIGSLPRTGQFASIAAPAWSPDGTLLAVEVIQATFVVPTEGGMDYASDLYVLRVAAPAESPWRALTANGRSRSASWSPDGARIAYVGPSMPANNNHIYVVDAVGGEPVRLTRTEGSYGGPRWSPDGTRLVFSDGGVGNGDVFIVNADGTGLTNVTRSSAYDADPSWSPDGARLAFVSDRDKTDATYRRDVFVVDIDGSNLRRLTRDLSGGWSWSSGPAWSPDGRQIIFSLTATRENPGGIYVMNTDGSSLVRLTTPPPNSWDGAPAWRR